MTTAEAGRKSRLSGVLLAAGAARRFGAPKQLAELEGRRLVLHALDSLLAVPALADVLVVVGSRGDEVARVVEGTGAERVRVIRCADWEEGIAASLRSGVTAAAAAGADGVLVHLADLPRVPPQVIAAILEHACHADGRLRGVPARATYHGIDGHPVVLPRVMFASVAARRSDTGARALLAGPDTRRLEIGHLGDQGEVDTPEDLQRLSDAMRVRVGGRTDARAQGEPVQHGPAATGQRR